MKQKGLPVRQAGLAPILIVVLIAVLAVGGYLIYKLPRTSVSPPAPQTTPAPSPTPDATTNWKTYQTERDNISFSFKYPSIWESPFLYCKTPPTYPYELNANCLNIVLFTKDLPKENQEPADNSFILAEEIFFRLGSYQAKRKVYNINYDDPDTYQVWAYDSLGKPFFLFLAWIGRGSDRATSKEFINIFDQILSTFKFTN